MRRPSRRASRRIATVVACVMAGGLACAVMEGCASHEAPQETTRPPMLEPFPGVRVDLAEKVVEFDGVVPIDPHDRETPLVFLEVVVCSRNTREHETLVVTEAAPSHVHAALLMLGAEQGAPGGWKRDEMLQRIVPSAPRGSAVRVEFEYRGKSGKLVRENPSDWICDVRTHRRLSGQVAGEPVWVFAGSAIAPRPDGPGEYYKGDIEGTLVGLATFGTETLAWPKVFSPEAAVEAPEWIADASRVPALGTRVTVRLRLGEPHEQTQGASAGGA